MLLVHLSISEKLYEPTRAEEDRSCLREERGDLAWRAACTLTAVRDLHKAPVWKRTRLADGGQLTFADRPFLVCKKILGSVAQHTGALMIVPLLEFAAWVVKAGKLR